MSFLLNGWRHACHRSLRVSTFAAVVMLVSVEPANAQALSFFKNFFVSGNYVAAGIDFGSQSGGGGVITGEVHFGSGNENAVPPNADLLGAILYWQTITTTTQNPLPANGVKFRGIDISARAKLVGTQSLSSTYAPCWSSARWGWRAVPDADIPSRCAPGSANSHRSRDRSAHGKADHQRRRPVGPWF